MSGAVVLSGTEDELCSYRALKILVASAYASAPLTRRVVSDPSTLSPLATKNGLALTMPDGKTSVGGSSSYLCSVVARLSPSSGLRGSSLLEEAEVDGWTSFVRTNVEIPLGALSMTDDEGVKEDLSRALLVLERHLTYKTFLVGNAVTVADVVGCCALRCAKETNVWSPSDHVHVTRWYETVVHQDPFASALALSAKGPTAGPSSGGAGALPPGAVARSGFAPPVVPTLYKKEHVRVKELLAEGVVGSTVKVCGWARTTRNADKGRILFVELTDGSTDGVLQCVLQDGATDGFQSCKDLGGTGASFSFRGTLVESPAAGQPVELKVEEGECLGPVYGGDAAGTTVGGAHYPLSGRRHSLEHLRDHAHLRPRTRVHAAAMRVRHAMAYATHRFFHDHGFLYVHTPIVTCADCEGAGEQFGVTTLLGTDHHQAGVQLPLVPPPDDKPLSKKEQKRLAKKKAAAVDDGRPVDHRVPGAVDYVKDFFGRRANLTVSGQLNVETHACALGEVYTFGPTFRAENSHTGRHLAEFWMIEPEICFADLDQDINLAEDYLKYCVQYALEACTDDLAFFEDSPFGEKGLRDRLRNVLETPFKRLTYTEGIEILQKATDDGVNFEEKPVWGMDLPTEMERYLCETVYKGPVVLTNYPKDIKAFYMKLNPDEKTVAAADVLVPKIGEIIGGSQREHRLDVLTRRCEETGLDPRQVWWYRELRRFGTVPHAGFGLGFERLILFVTGLDNIRDVIPFPRWPGNAEF